MQVGMVGLGRMGANMVRRLLRAGHQCVVYNRSPEAVEKLVRVDAEEWRAELPGITEWFETIGETVPAALWSELDGLKQRLDAD